MTGTRIIALLLALVFGMSVGTTAHAKPTAGQKCQKLRDKQRAKFVDKRLAKQRKLTKCANKAIKKGTDAAACLTSPKTQGKLKITDKKCSVAALAEKGVTGDDCSDLNSQCTGTVSDAASLVSCLDCALKNSSNCLVALEYGLSTDGCFDSSGGGS